MTIETEYSEREWLEPEHEVEPGKVQASLILVEAQQPERVLMFVGDLERIEGKWRYSVTSMGHPALFPVTWEVVERGGAGCLVIETTTELREDAEVRVVTVWRAPTHVASLADRLVGRSWEAINRLLFAEVAAPIWEWDDEQEVLVAQLGLDFNDEDDYGNPVYSGDEPGAFEMLSLEEVPDAVVERADIVTGAVTDAMGSRLAETIAIMMSTTTQWHVGVDIDAYVTWRFVQKVETESYYGFLVVEVSGLFGDSIRAWVPARSDADVEEVTRLAMTHEARGLLPLDDALWIRHLPDYRKPLPSDDGIPF